MIEGFRSFFGQENFGKYFFGQVNLSTDFLWCYIIYCFLDFFSGGGGVNVGLGFFSFLGGGGCFKHKRFSVVSIFAPIRSSLSLEIRITSPHPPPEGGAAPFIFLQDVTKTRNEHEERENKKWEKKKPNFNPSLLSNLVSKSLFCSHFSFSHPPLLVPCSPFPVQ